MSSSDSTASGSGGRNVNVRRPSGHETGSIPDDSKPDGARSDGLKSAAAKGPAKRAADLARPRLRQARAEANLERLLTSAAGLMASKGYEQTSIRDVAREAGISLAGMYYYFKGKEELLYRIQHRTFGALLEEQERKSSEGGSPEARLRRLICNHLSYLATHAKELKVCTFELESLQGDYYKEIERLRRRYYRLIAGIVGELMSRSGKREEQERDIRHQTLFIFGMLNWVFMWFDPARDAPTEELGDKMVSFVLHGFQGRKSRRRR